MIEAAERLRDPEARLVLIGSFATPELEQEARSLPGWRRVDYLGPLRRPEVGEQLAAARAGLVLFHPQPNHTEALPNKIFEYMAAGLPIVASDFPYWRSLLEPIGCAVWVDPLDPAGIATAMDDLLADEEGAGEMGRRGGGPGGAPAQGVPAALPPFASA
jgi:glycosyltransferase involved in cell wall biosynthesis